MHTIFWKDHMITDQIQEMQQLVWDLVNENPDVKNPRREGMCVYMTFSPAEGEYKYCIAGAILHKFDLPMPAMNVGFHEIAPSRFHENTINWLTDVQTIFDYHTEAGGTWSTAYDELKQRGYV